MAKYIPQHFFNLAALTAAKIYLLSDTQIEVTAQEFATNYNRSYDDSNLKNDIAAAANQAIDFIQSVLPPESVVANLTQLQYSAMNFEPTGKKRRKKLLGGTWFNKEKAQINDKVGECKVNLATYHMLLVGGSLPLAPQGWTIGGN